MAKLAEQIGQLLIVGIDCPKLDSETNQFLRDLQPGGLIFFQRNIPSTEDFRLLVKNCSQVLTGAPFLSVDLEGGLVDRFRGVVSPLPAVRDVARAGMGRELGELAGREVAAFGLNVDYAPVFDLGTPESEPVLGSRTAGSTPDEVIQFAREFLGGLRSTGVLGCGKHFPGLGSGRSDSHKEMPTITKSGTEMWAEDLKPYQVMAGELPMVMVAHAYCPGLEDTDAQGSTNGLPASLSRHIVTGILKERLNYSGLVLCDDLEMGGALQGRSMEEAAVGTLLAGCEILLLCGASANSHRVYEALLKEAETSPALRSCVAAAAQKIAAAKERLLPGGSQPRPAIDLATLKREIEQLCSTVQSRLSSMTAK